MCTDTGKRLGYTYCHAIALFVTLSNLAGAFIERLNWMDVSCLCLSGSRRVQDNGKTTGRG